MNAFPATGAVLHALLTERCLLMYCESSPQKINEKPQVIADYECGRAIPNNQVMGKIERAIGKTTVLFF